MSKIKIKGMILRDVSPLINQVLDLPEGISILYGKNGVGKTRVLKAASYAVKPIGEAPGAFTLAFSYPFDEVRTHRDRRQSPWSHLNRHIPSVPEPFDNDNLQKIIDDFNGFADFDPKRDENTPLLNLARHIYTVTDMYNSPIDSKATLAAICIDIAEQGAFNLDIFGHRRRLSAAATVSDSNSHLSTLIHSRKDCSLEENKDEYGDQFGDSLTHFVEEAKNYRYPWLGESINEIQTNSFFIPPIDLVDEENQDLFKITLDYFVDLLKMSKIKLNSDIEEIELDNVSLLVETSSKFKINPIVTNTAEQLSIRATEYFRKLMIDAPNLKCKIRDLGRWGLGPPIEWIAEEKYREYFDEESMEHELSISNLSNAQQRWATFAIKLSMVNAQGERPLLLVIDEPEAGLHRRAERQLAIGLAQITESFNAQCLLATHSPVFLNDKKNNLIHVYRNDSGNTALDSLSNKLSDRIDDYGIDRSDLLQFCNKFVIVEGVHDCWVLDEMFGEEFDKAGATVLALRGLKKLELLSALDSQFIFNFTTAEILIMFDNDKTRAVQEIWHRACKAKDQNQDVVAILDELRELAKNSGKKSDEYSMIHDFCVSAINQEARSRVKFHGLVKPDIIDYFKPEAFLEKKLASKGFNDLRIEFDRNGGSNFKEWLAKNYGASFAEENFRNAVRQSDSIHTDFIELLNIVIDN